MISQKFNLLRQKLIWSLAKSRLKRIELKKPILQNIHSIKVQQFMHMHKSREIYEFRVK